jgi:S-disulfanyl-L-cysteine oxidoreductase SoxD
MGITVPMKFLFISGAVVMLAVMSSRVRAQDTVPKPLTTMSGVYTNEQATRGQETYTSICLSCHSLAEQSGANFSKKWVGFPLWDLYDYISVNMPQSDPGTLTPKEYAQVVAYLLKINGMPAGKDEVPSDTLSLKKIKVDTIPVSPLGAGSGEFLKQLLRKH